MRRRQSPQPKVHTVTSAPSRPHDDQDYRLKRYLIMMGIRIACFAVIPFVTGWVRWACVAGAVLLPYIAVVLANAVRPSQRGFVEPIPPEERPRLEITGS